MLAYLKHVWKSRPFLLLENHTAPLGKWYKHAVNSTLTLFVILSFEASFKLFFTIETIVSTEARKTSDSNKTLDKIHLIRFNN